MDHDEKRELDQVAEDCRVAVFETLDEDRFHYLEMNGTLAGWCAEAAKRAIEQTALTYYQMVNDFNAANESVIDVGDGFVAFVRGHGTSPKMGRLSDATRWIREKSGRKTGPVPCWDQPMNRLTSEVDIAEGA